LTCALENALHGAGDRKHPSPTLFEGEAVLPPAVKTLAAVKRRTAKFRQVDLKRALKAATSAGLNVQRIEVDPETGRIVIATGADQVQAAPTPLQDWLSKRNAR
jgi:hypothetical protein